MESRFGNDGRSHVHVFFHVTAIDDKGIGKFALTINGNRAGIQVT